MERAVAGPPVEAITRLLRKMHNERVACQSGDCGNRARIVQNTRGEPRLLCPECSRRDQLHRRFGLERRGGMSIAEAERKQAAANADLARDVERQSRRR